MLLENQFNSMLDISPDENSKVEKLQTDFK